MARRPLWLLSVPLALVGCLLGHRLGYAIAGDPASERILHGYLAYTPLVLAAGGALVVTAVCLRAAGRLSGRPAAWVFALVPSLAFVVQEAGERAAAGVPLSSVLEPAVLAGLLAQLPLALLAYLAARTFLRVADAIAAALAAPRLSSQAAFAVVLSAVEPLLRAPLAFDRLGRAPPRA